MSFNFNKLPNFRPIVLNSCFLTFNDARKIINEKRKFIDWYIRLDIIIYMDDYDLIDGDTYENLLNEIQEAKDTIQNLEDQLRCWNLCK